MSDLASTDIIVAPETEEKTSYVDWPAIIAGIVLASAISRGTPAFSTRHR